MDALTTDIGEKLVARATADSLNVPTHLDLIFASRAPERVGDHATIIAEDSFWRDQATDIRHTQGRSGLPLAGLVYLRREVLKF